MIVQYDKNLPLLREKTLSIFSGLKEEIKKIYSTNSKSLLKIYKYALLPNLFSNTFYPFYLI